MSKNSPKVLILSGDGIHGEMETAEAFRSAHFDVDIQHLNYLIREGLSFDQFCSRYSAFAIAGGPSSIDGLSPGRMLALKLLYGMRFDLLRYVSRGGLVLGIGNGFQALIKMGVFGREIAVTQNIQGKWLSRWVRVTPSGEKCIWLKGLGTLDLPIRHAQGRFVVAPSRRVEILRKMDMLGMTCLKYEGDPVGSEERIAGLCDASGRILGLMPHPECFIRWTSHPEWTTQPGRASAPGQGLTLFERAYQEAMLAR